VVLFSGKWFFGDVEPEAYNMPLLDSVNILFNVLVNERAYIQGGARLESMRLTYDIVWHEPEKFYFLPCWELVFTDGAVMSYNTLNANRVN
jgi:hypothetical protein